jgi:hypothetical protein
MKDDNFKVLVIPFKPAPEGNILAVLNALGRPIVISVAKHLSEEKQTELVNNLKMLWQALAGSKENEFMHITIRDINAKQEIELDEAIY